MVSLINFGGIKQVNGRNVISGLSSGYDTAAIVEQLATAKRLPATKFEDTIEVNNNKISALTDLKSKLTNLKSAVAKLRNPVGFGSGTSNAFEARSAFMSMTTGDTAANYLGVTTANGAPVGKYVVEVDQLATAENHLSESFSSLSASVVAGDASGGPTTGKFNAGTFTISYTDDEGDPQTETITLTAGSNLATVRDTINAKTNTTGVKATIVKLSDTDYRLKLYSTETGTDNGFDFTAGTGTEVNFTETAAVNSRMYLDGELVTRSSNVIDDLLDNVTFTLYQETAGAEINLDIDSNNQGVAEGIAGFLDSYNEFRLFNAQQNEIDEDGNVSETAYLRNNSVLSSITAKMSNIFTSSKGASLLSPDELGIFSTDSDLEEPTTLGDLGIYFTDQAASDDEENPTPAVENMLALDVTTLTNNLQKYFTKSRELFEFTFSSTNSEIASYKRSNAVFENDVASFSLSINHTAKTVSVTALKDSNGAALTPASISMDYDDDTGTVLLTGQDGTVLEGMEFFFIGTASGTTTSDITVKQGVGDVMFNTLEEFVEEIDGNLSLIDAEIESLTDQNEDAQASIDRIDLMVTSYRDLMLEKFSALEALISASNQTLTLLDAQANAAQNS